MKDIDYIKKFAPDLIDKFIFRYKILEYISLNAPIGRRSISSYLGVGERLVRNELEFLTEEKFVEVIKSGTFITNLGESILIELRDLINNFNENQDIADELRLKLGIKKVIVCDSYDDESLGKEQIAKVASEYFLNIISENDVIAISGGTTVYIMIPELMKSLTRLSSTLPQHLKPAHSISLRQSYAYILTKSFSVFNKTIFKNLRKALSKIGHPRPESYFLSSNTTRFLPNHFLLILAAFPLSIVALSASLNASVSFLSSFLNPTA